MVILIMCIFLIRCQVELNKMKETSIPKGWGTDSKGKVRRSDFSYIYECLCRSDFKTKMFVFMYSVKKSFPMVPNICFTKSYFIIISLVDF